MDLLNVHDFEKAAKLLLSQGAYGYYVSGAGDEKTLHNNRLAFDRILLKNRILANHPQHDLQVTLFGKKSSMPIFIAPSAGHQMAHQEGEVATARAAHYHKTTMILSTLSNLPLEEVRTATSSPLWFQLYIYKDRALTESLVRRIEKAGYEALVLTADAPYLGRRERDLRNDFHLPTHLTFSNALDLAIQIDSHQSFSDYFNTLIADDLSWKDVVWLRSITSLPLIIKGITHPQDAKIALSEGVDGIICSNHGGRQLDSQIATIQALPDIMAVVENNMPVLIDGGIRHGTDIFKALALGASAVLIGRPILWGLAVDGEHGVNQVLTLLKNELSQVMGLCGFDCIADVQLRGKDNLYFL